MAVYTIHLINVRTVRPAAGVRAVITEAFQPLVEAAGFTLNLVDVALRNADSVPVPDVSLEFKRGPIQLGRQFQGSMMLAEQSGAVLVGRVLGLRVGGVVRRSRASVMDRRHPLERRTLPVYTTHLTTTRPLFRQGEAAFARAVGNIGVHELGHTIGGLDHVADSFNYMFTGAFMDQVLPPEARTYERLRAVFAGRQHFTSDQQEDLTDAIRARDLRGVEMTRLR